MRRFPRLSRRALMVIALIAASCAPTSDGEIAALGDAQEELDRIAADGSERRTNTRDGEPEGSGRRGEAPEFATPEAGATTTLARSGTPPEIAEFRCPFDVDDLAPVRCGRITVPGRGVDPDFTATIAFARFSSEVDPEDRAADPVVYLHGGPGGSILADADYWYSSVVGPHIDQRDVILFDQRGGGRSTTLPLCHEVAETSDRFYTESVDHRRLAPDYVDALGRCADKYEDSTAIDLTAFNSAANAQDVVDLMWALGVEQYNLHGSSYGTRLAQTIMRDVPEGVRSVVLSGSYPISANLMGSIPVSMQSSLDAVFAGCAASSDCNTALPDPWATLGQLVAELDAEPLVVAVPDNWEESTTIAFDGTDLLNGLHSVLYTATSAASVPDLLIDHLDGDDRRLLRLARTSVFDHTDIATFLLVQCADEAAFTTDADLRRPLDHEFLRAVDFAPALNGLDAVEICADWDTGPVDPAENSAVGWDVPTLLLAGAADPITPPDWARDLAAVLPRSQLAVRADASHDSDEGWCALDLIGEFVRDPDAALDTSCAASADHLTVDDSAVRFTEPTALIDVTLDLGGDEDVEVRIPNWLSDWRGEVHIRWQTQDPLDPTALIIVNPGIDHDPFQYYGVPGITPDLDPAPSAREPAGWGRSAAETTAGTVIRYEQADTGLTAYLLMEPGEARDLELNVLVPFAESV